MKKTILLLFAFTFSLFTVHAQQDPSLEAGWAALKSHNYKGAQDAFTKYVNSFKDKVDAYLSTKQGYDTANAFYKQTKYSNFKINHDWASGYAGLGAASFNLGLKFDAIKDCETATKIDPTNAVGYYYLGVIKKDAGDKMGACKCIGAALTYSDTMKVAKDAYQNYFCWESAQEYYKKGMTEVSIKEYPEALRDMRIACMMSSDSGNYYGYLGMAYQGVGKADSAVAAFAKAIKLNPNSYSAYYYRGLVEEDKQQYQEAFDDLSKAIKISPKSAEAYIHRANVCENLDKEAAAQYDYQQIIVFKPDYGQAYYKIALYRQKLGQDACDYFKKAADLGVDDAQSYVDDCKKAEQKRLERQK